MTRKTTLTARVTPDTRAALDRLATAGHTTTSELAGRVLTEWVAQQADANDAHEHVLSALASAYGLIARAEYGNTDIVVINAMRYLADAVNVLAGTAPEEG